MQRPCKDMSMSVIATNMAMEVAMLLVPEKTQVQRGWGDKDGERRDKKKKRSPVNRMLTSYEEKNTPSTGQNNPHRQAK